MLSFLSTRAIAGVEVVSGDVYARSISLEGAHGVISVRPCPSAKSAAGELLIKVHFPRLNSLPAIISRIRRVFDLAADPHTINAHLARDPLLAPLVAARPGLRVAGAWEGFELAIRAILGQQITVGAARGLAGRLVAQFGRPPSGELASLYAGVTHAFPLPEQLVDADIAALGMPGARATALSSLARAVVSEPAILGQRHSLDETVRALKSLPGIGEWTAQYIAMRELREPDAFPAADVGLLRAMQTPRGKRPTPSELLARAECWRPWRAYAAAHLWTSLHTQSIAKEQTDAISINEAA